MRYYNMMRKLIIVLASLLMSIPLIAQRQGLKNIPYIDQRRVHYGFLLGINMSDVTFEHTGKNGWGAECSALNPAFCVGLMGDVALTENLNIRVSPSLHFMSRDVDFMNYQTNESRTQVLKTNYLELPVSLKIATRRLNNYRPYLLMGAQVDYDLAHEKEQPIVFGRMDIGMHIALGCDLYLPYFKFCPELRFNLGLLDMLDHKRKDLKDETLRPYTEALSRARNKSISLVFFFE